MSDNNKVPCKYGAKCYQTNQAHLEKYSHSAKRSRTPDDDLKKKAKIVEDSINFEEKKIKQEMEKETVDSSPIATCILLNDDEKKTFIKDKFLVEMPDDFYSFWELCVKINSNCPKDAFKSVGLVLTGPYDVLADCLEKRNDDEYLIHSRYYYDTPEFQTVVKGDAATGFHMGYFRDSPDELPVFVGSSNEKNDCTITQMGGNIYGAMNMYLEEIMSKADPFKKMSLEKLMNSLRSKAKNLNIDLSKVTSTMQKRNRKTVCKSFHTAGIVVPYNRKTQVGYRDMQVSEKELRNLLDKVAKAPADQKLQSMVDLQPVMNAATIANDECDFGTSLELGIDMFCHGNECLNNSALRFLNTSYGLLNRDGFAKIASVHLKNRKRIA